MTSCIDVFCHCLPKEFCTVAHRLVASASHMFGRAQAIPVMVDLQTRFRLMDTFPGYRQIPSLASPPLETMAEPRIAVELAKIANDSMAAFVANHPDRFPGFVASLPLNDPDAALAEAERAVLKLGAAGVQVFSNVNGKPLDEPEYLSILERMAELQAGVWLHPARGPDNPDYQSEKASKYDLWWALGWPYETSVAMGRLVFSGIFERYPNLIVITHHVGGIIPMLEGRLASGLDQVGTRTPSGLEEFPASKLVGRPIDSFRRFYADTASFGSQIAIECGRAFFGADRLLFATDMPFDPDQGPGYIRDTLAALLEMDLEPQVLDQILQGNAKRLFGLERKPANIPALPAQEVICDSSVLRLHAQQKLSRQ